MFLQQGEPALFVHMVAVFVIIAGMLTLYATERLSPEMASLSAISALLLLFGFFPLADAGGDVLIDAASLLAGFANPALLTVLALLVLGEGLARTGMLDRLAAHIHKTAKGRSGWATAIILLTASGVSAFLNNIPVVVIFVPIMQALSARAGHAASRYMMPLSFAAILGGMTTLIGSSTNLLVSSAMIQLGEPGFDFFEFTVPGLVMAGVGLIYVVLVAPRLLPERQGFTHREAAGGKQFQTRFKVVAGSRLDGMQSVGGFFPDLKGVTISRVICGGKEYYPPFEDITLKPGDILIAAATRDVLAALVAEEQAAFLSPAEEDHVDLWRRREQTLAEAMVRPGSPYVGKTVRELRRAYRERILVIGLERRSGMSRRLFNETPLEAGDVLLLQGAAEELEALRHDRELLPMEWSVENLAKPHRAKSAVLIFAGVVLLAATGVTSTVTAAITGAVLMVAFRVLSLESALKALDRQIIFLIAAALALGQALEKTGGATFLSHALMSQMGDVGPAAVLSGFFLLVACVANVLSTKATAVLFAPIAVAVAHQVGAPVQPFAVAVVFAANCAFASPAGYQTNLLVMTPGHYRFMDFVKFGAPLIFICWATFSLFAPWWYGLL